MSFDDAFNYLIKTEGGYVNDLDDAGGATKYGISLRFLQSINFDVNGDGQVNNDDIISLTLENAKEIYYQKFWLPIYDEITASRLSTYIFDMSVNLSPKISHTIFQRSTWAWQQKINYLEDDGIFGKESLKVANANGLMLMPSLRAERAGYYRTLVQIKPKLSKFLKGWLNRTYSL